VTRGRIRTVDLDGRAVPVALRRNGQARRLIIRLKPGRGNGEADGISVTLPPGAKETDAIRFVEEKKGWVLATLDSLTPKIPFDDGTVIPFLGNDYPIRRVSGKRGGVWIEDGEICVSGRPEHVPRRVRDWIKREAKRMIASKVKDKAGILGVRVGRITLRDTRSRWGSCASTGNLSFSWCLALAPEFVLDYVVAHEVAHLVEHNHGPGFWALVDSLTERAKEGRRWLRRSGETLHRYG